MQGDYGGFAVDRFTHSLQTATRALRGGEDEEYIVCALLHDIGETLSAPNHPEIAIAILRPYVSEANAWMIAHHAIFQGYFFFDKLDPPIDRHARESLRGEPHFDHTERFVALYDEPSFDPDYDTLTLEAFVPMAERVFALDRNSYARRFA